MRYYISNRLLHGKDPTGWRLPAKTIETTIAEATRRHFQDSAVRARLFNTLPATEVPALADRMVEHLGSCCKVASLLSQLVARIDLAQDEVVIQLDAGFSADRLGIEANAISANEPVIRALLRLRRRGVEQKILIGEAKPDPNAALLKCLAQAHQWVALLKQGKTLPDVAAHAGVEQNYIRKRIRLSTLCPRIQRAIATGDHPDHWSILTLIRMKLPMAWDAQEKLLLRDQKPASLQRRKRSLFFPCSGAKTSLIS